MSFEPSTTLQRVKLNFSAFLTGMFAVRLGSTQDSQEYRLIRFDSRGPTVHNIFPNPTYPDFKAPKIEIIFF